MRTPWKRSAMPPGYPQELEHPCTLGDGRVVDVRPVVPEDVHELRRAIAAADPDTLRARFLGAAPPHDEESLRHLVEVDYDRRLAVAAFAPDGEGVGIARYEGSAGSTTAEVAVVVHRDWRHVGLASDLVLTLARGAEAHGITTFTASTLASNQDVRELVASAGAAHRSLQVQDLVEETIDVLRLNHG